MGLIQMVRDAEAQIRDRYPELTGRDFDREVEDLVSEWQSHCESNEIEDTWCIESGRDNCDDWGTGEGAFHGRM